MPLNVNDYQCFAMTTLNRAIPREELLLNALMGLCGESGEAIDILKKHRFQGHPLDQDRIVKELGDIAWYLAEAAEALDIPLEEILRRNLDKLAARYPRGFAAEDSRQRGNDG